MITEISATCELPIKSFGSMTDLKELFKRIAFNIIVRNTDDHPRNHGFLRENGYWHLSPAFDITPTASIKGITSAARLTMSCGDFGHEASKENLLTSCGIFGLSKEEGSAIFDNVAKTISQNWRNVFDEFDVSEGDASRFCHIFSSYDEWRG